MLRTKKKYLSFVLRFLIAGMALYVAFRGENPGQIAGVLLGLNGRVLASAFGLWFVSQLIFVTRWFLLLKVQSIEIGFWPAAKLYFLGIFYSNCLPTTIGGDLIRAWYVTMYTDKKLEAALSVFVDRAIGFAGMIIMAYCSYWFILTEAERQQLDFSFSVNLFHRLIEHQEILLVIGVVLVGGFTAFVSNARGRTVLRNGFEFVCRQGAAGLQKIRNAIGIYYHHKVAIVLAFVLTLCCQSIFIVGLWLVGREIGINAHFKYYFIFFPMSWILGTLPISVAALGIWEGVLKLTFGKVATVSKEHLSALALAHRIIWLFGSLPGIAIYLMRAHLPKDSSVGCDKSID